VSSVKQQDGSLEGLPAPGRGTRLSGEAPLVAFLWAIDGELNTG